VSAHQLHNRTLTTSFPADVLPRGPGSFSG
jgi:hypothetical protein